jgi:hypothetical protein
VELPEPPNPGTGITVYPPGIGLVEGIALVFGWAILTGLLACVYLVALGRDLF